MNKISKAKTIFAQAVENLSPEQWSKFLDEECNGDSELRSEVEKLLAAHQQSHHLLDGGIQPGDAPTEDLVEINVRSGHSIGPYKLLEQIGEGGMGTVFMAEQTEPVRRRVALKIVKAGMDSKLVMTRFEAERQALALMDHPNIAKVLDAGTESNQPYFVMELVKGIPITEFCDQEKLSLRERLELFIPVCQAVQHAHQKGIIHRDIKPSNVLVAMYDDQPVPKIIDFGVAKAIHQPLTEKTMFTQFGQILGTFEYMSPEQAKFNQLDIDTRSDIYSLGVLLYELLTGDTPFDKQRLRSAAFDEIVRIIREEDPPRPSTRLDTSQQLPAIASKRKAEPARLSSTVRGELDWIVMKALDKDRARRYETAGQFATDVNRYLADEPIEARPASVTYRMQKFMRRKKGLVAAVALITFLLLAGSIGSTTGWIQARFDADRARQAETVAINEKQKTKEALEQATVAQAKLADELTQSESMRIVATANANKDIAPGQALVLSVEGAQRAIERNSFHNTALLDALRRNRERLTVDIPSLINKRFNKYDKLTGIHTIPNSPNVIVCLSGSPSAVVLNARTGELVCQIGNTGQTFDLVDVSNDGRYMATVTAGRDEVILPSGESIQLTGAAPRIWDLQNGQEVQVLVGHRDQVCSIDFNSDGSQLVSGSFDGETIIWNVRNGQPLHRFAEETDLPDIIEAYDSKAWSRLPILLTRFSHDDSRVVTVDGQQSVWRFLDLQLPQDGIDPPANRFKDGKEGGGSRGGGNTTMLQELEGINPKIRLWDIQSNSIVFSHEFKERNMNMPAAGFLPDGRHLLLNTQNGLSMHDASSGEMIDSDRAIKVMDINEYELNGIKFKVCRSDQEIIGWQYLNGRWVFSQPGSHSPPIRYVAPVIYGTRGLEKMMLATVNDQPWMAIVRDEQIRFFEAGAGVDSGIDLKGNTSPIVASATTNESELMTLSDDGILRVWNVVKPLESPIAIRPNVENSVPDDIGLHPAILSQQAFIPPNPEELVGIVRFSKDGKFMAVAGQHDNGRYEDGQPTWPGFYGSFGSSSVFVRSVDRMQWSRIGDRFTRAYGRKKNLLDLAKQQLDQFSGAGFSNRFGNLESFDLSPDGRFLVTVHRDGIRMQGSEEPVPQEDYLPVRVWDVATGKQLYGIPGMIDAAYLASFSPDGSHLVTLTSGNHTYYTEDDNGQILGVGTISGRGEGGRVDLWDAATGEHLQLVHQAENPNKNPRNVLWDPRGNGRLLFDRHDEHHQTVIYDVPSQQEIALLKGPQAQILRYSPDGEFIAGFQTTTTIGNTIRVWDSDDGQLESQINRNSNWNATSFGFSPDGQSMALSYDDGTCQVFYTTLGAPKGWMIGHARRVNSIQYSPDGKWITTASDDGTCRIWQVGSTYEWLLIDLDSEVLSAQFTPDSQQVVTITRDGKAQAWPVDPLPLAIDNLPRKLLRDEIVRFQVMPLEEDRETK